MKHIPRISFAFLLLALFASPTLKAQQKFKSDPIHSGVHYIVRHVMTPMMGSFETFNVDMTWDVENPEKGTISATLDASSVQMGSEKLTQHIKGPDFFDVANHPEWTFVSKEIQEDDGRYMAVGELTVRGITNPVTVPFDYKGSVNTKYGEKAGFVGEFSIDRTAYDIKYDPDGKGVGKEVKIMVFLEMNAAE